MKALFSVMMIAALFAGLSANAAECKYKAEREAQLRAKSAIVDQARALSSTSGSVTPAPKPSVLPAGVSK